MTDETSAPTVDELEAKSERLAGDVLTAEKGLETAKATFGKAIKSDPNDVLGLVELAKAITAAEAAIGKAQSAVKGNQTGIDGIRYDEDMAGVLAASGDIQKDIRPIVDAWFADNSNIVSDYSIDTLAITAKREPSGAVTVSVKPTGDAMPKRPSAKRTGNGGPKGKRNVTVDGVPMSCRDYVASCGTDASPAAQADLAGSWDGSPVSYTNEAKRLAAKRNDTFA